jgi:hypothetical protein
VNRAGAKTLEAGPFSSGSEAPGGLRWPPGLLARDGIACLGRITAVICGEDNGMTRVVAENSCRYVSPMCNLYSLNKKRDMVARFFRVSHNRAVMFEPLPAVFPRHVAPVVRRTADGEREIVTMSWGFMLLQNGRAPRPVTNMRDDKILTSSFWKIVIRGAALPRAGVVLLRTQRRREASDVALVFAQGI